MIAYRARSSSGSDRRSTTAGRREWRHGRSADGRAHGGARIRHHDAAARARDVAGARAASAVVRCAWRSRPGTGTSTRRRCTATSEEVGQAVAESGVPRAELFVTTKLPQSHAGRERATLEESLDALGFDYVDLWLIHWPPSGAPAGRVGAAARAAGGGARARGRGEQLQRSSARRARADATGRLPAVNQIEWSPALFDRTCSRRTAPRRAARGLQPAQDNEPARPPTRADRREARRHAGAGRSPLAHRAPDRRDPEVDKRGAASPRTRRSSTSS